MKIMTPVVLEPISSNIPLKEETCKINAKATDLKFILECKNPSKPNENYVQAGNYLSCALKSNSEDSLNLSVRAKYKSPSGKVSWILGNESKWEKFELTEHAPSWQTDNLYEGGTYSLKFDIFDENKKCNSLIYTFFDVYTSSDIVHYKTNRNVAMLGLATIFSSMIFGTPRYAEFIIKQTKIEKIEESLNKIFKKSNKEEVFHGHRG